MAKLLEYSGLAAKLRAMQGKLLNKEDYQTLTSMSSIGEAINWLKRHPAYEKVLDKLDDSNLHRGHIEKLLTLSLYQDFDKLYRFSGSLQRKYLKLYFKKYEIDLIKYFFRAVSNHYHRPFYLSTRRDFFDRYSNLNFDDLKESESLAELIEKLRQTEYYPTLQRVKQRSHAALYDYESAIDLYFFTTFWKSKDQLLKGKERNVSTHNIGTEIDLLNLQWIYRGKKSYNLSATKLFAITIPIHYKLRKADYISLTETKDVSEYLQVWKQTYYGNKFEDFSEKNMEHAYLVLQKHIFNRNAKQNPYSIAILDYFLFQKDLEIDTLTTILECIRYRLEPDDIKRMIGGDAL